MQLALSLRLGLLAPINISLCFPNSSLLNCQHGQSCSCVRSGFSPASFLVGRAFWSYAFLSLTDQLLAGVPGNPSGLTSCQHVAKTIADVVESSHPKRNVKLAVAVGQVGSLFSKRYLFASCRSLPQHCTKARNQ